MSYWGTVMDSTNKVPYGKRLVPVLIDEIAARDPDRVCFSFPRSTDLKDGFVDMKFQTFANAINKTARFIEREIGRSSMFETVMYMGHPDVRHQIVLVALMKTGHKVLFSSHCNSITGHLELIRRTDCGILLHTAGFPMCDNLEASRMESLCMPELEYLLDDSIHVEPYPYNRTFDQAKHHPCMIIHTPGPHGLPKPVIWTHWAFTTIDAQRMVPDLDGRPSVIPKLFDSCNRSFWGYPIFHGPGIIMSLTLALYSRSTSVLGPPGIPTAATLEQIIDYGRIDAANLSPSSLEDIAASPSTLAKLQRLNFITFGEGTLSPRAGDIIARHTPLYIFPCGSETGPLIQHAPDPQDWQYLVLSPDYNGIEWRPHGGALYELVIRRNSDVLPMQGAFKLQPHADEHPTSNLYSRHPSKPHHWKHEGRSDNLIVFKSGWGFNPEQHEALISSHEAVEHCVLVGAGRNVPVAIVQLRQGLDADREETREGVGAALAPRIEQVNGMADSAGQLGREAIVFARREKPFVVGAEGVVRRRETLALYEREVEEMYAVLGRLGRGVV